MRTFIILGCVALLFILCCYFGIPCSNNHIVYVLPFSKELLQSIIFYIEPVTSSALNIQQACAIESAARHNLKSEVKVFIISSKPVRDSFSLSHALSNIKLIRTTYDSIFRGTPLEQWYQRERKQNRTYFSNYIKESIQFLLVWKFGGVFLDTGVITLRTMNDFKEFVVKRSDSLIMTEVFGFQERHSFSTLCLKYLERNYGSRNFSGATNAIMTRALKDFCEVEDVESIHENHCQIYVLPSSVLLSSDDWSDYFSDSKLPYVLYKAQDLSSEMRFQLGSGAPLEEAMRSNCPLVYHHLAKRV